MLARMFFFMIGFGLTLLGCVFIISYLNLLTIGYNFLDYVNFISRRVECWNAVIGFLIILFSIYADRGGKHELHI